MALEHSWDGRTVQVFLLDFSKALVRVILRNNLEIYSVREMVTIWMTANVCKQIKRTTTHVLDKW